MIEGNFIGTDSTGRVELGNGYGGVGEGSPGFPGAGGGGADYFGILVGSRVFTSNQTFGSNLNRIGTNGDDAFDAAEKNLISGNDVPINATAKATIREGKNSLALHCHQNGGGQYIDVGIIELHEE